MTTSPYAFTGGFSYSQKKNEMMNVNGWKELGSGGLFGEWERDGHRGGTFSVQPTIDKEKCEVKDVIMKHQHSGFD